MGKIAAHVAAVCGSGGSARFVRMVDAVRPSVALCPAHGGSISAVCQTVMAGAVVRTYDVRAQDRIVAGNNP